MAQQDFAKVTDLHPDDAQAWMQLGNAMEHQHHLKEALETYQKVSALDPDLVDAYYASAMIYDQQLQPKKAMASLNRALARIPDSNARIRPGPSSRRRWVIRQRRTIWRRPKSLLPKPRNFRTSMGTDRRLRRPRRSKFPGAAAGTIH